MPAKGASLSAMFDPEVIEILRAQFDEADADRSGQIDSSEAAALFTRFCSPGASEREIQRTADGLRSQMDSDRNGKISFEVW
ncbi:hypothetical protein T484DRAFT_1805847 [Baffinella frigidus]|nr:hypothetical protein T484DRAFT_1805847 [Cryptophyta sp. CCMP2293]